LRGFSTQDLSHHIKLAIAVITHAAPLEAAQAKKLFMDDRRSGRLMRFLVRVVPGRGRGRDLFPVVRTLSKYLGARAVNPKWTSYGALELDVFVDHPKDLDLLVAAIEPLADVEFARNLDEPPKPRSKEETVARAVSYFNAERFFESHEDLESLWRTSQGGEKELLQGMILVCAAFVHEQKGERGVALGIVKRSLPKLAWTAREYHGVDIGRLKGRMEKALSQGDLAVFKI